MLSEIIGCLEQIETVKEFRELVRMLLPEYESEIMAAPRNRRVYKFCYYFGHGVLPAAGEYGLSSGGLGERHAGGTDGDVLFGLSRITDAPRVSPAAVARHLSV